MRPLEEVQRIELALQLPESCRLVLAEADDPDDHPARYPVEPSRLVLEVCHVADQYLALPELPPDWLRLDGLLYGWRSVVVRPRSVAGNTVHFQYRRMLEVVSGGLV